MSCECCTNKAKWMVLKSCMNALQLPLDYCPVCSLPVHVRTFLDNMAKIEVCIPEVITDENGKTITLYRSPQHGTVTAYTPPDLSINLDKIDIEREMKLLGIKEQSDGN